MPANPTAAVEDKISQALTLGLFTLLCIVLYFQCDSLTHILQVNSDYKEIISKLDTKLKTTLAGKTKYEEVSVSARAGEKICMYLTKNIKALHPDEDLDPSETKLWPYLMHHTNGKELHAILTDYEGNCNNNNGKARAQAITKFTTCGASPADGIREILRELRRYNTGESTINYVSSMAQATFAIAMTLVMYPVFHTFYRSDSDFTTIVVALTVVSLFGFGGMYGWATQIAP